MPPMSVVLTSERLEELVEAGPVGRPARRARRHRADADARDLPIAKYTFTKEGEWVVPARLATFPLGTAIGCDFIEVLDVARMHRERRIHRMILR
jgi:hypothetical protein